MKQLVVVTALLSSGLGMAQEAGHAVGQVAGQVVGKVVSSVPVQERVAVPRQVCTTEQRVVQAPKSGAGAAMGAIAGGAVGNAIGDGTGRAAATMIGIVGGAMLGDRIEGEAPKQVESVQVCTTQNLYEYRTVAYQVTYEFAGRQYMVQMPNDPGPTIPLQVTPVGATSQPVVSRLQPVSARAVQHAGRSRWDRHDRYYRY